MFGNIGLSNLYFVCLFMILPFLGLLYVSMPLTSPLFLFLPPDTAEASSIWWIFVIYIFIRRKFEDTIRFESAICVSFVEH